MMIFIIILTTIIVLLSIISTILLIKLNAKTKKELKEYSLEILELKNFNPKEIMVINKNLTMAINSNSSMLAIIENFNPKLPQNYDYTVIATSFITEITKKGNTILVSYIKQGENTILRIHPTSKEIIEFFYKISKAINLKKIEQKYPDTDFPITSASDWECSFLWAYNPLKTHFAYLKTKENEFIYKLDLKREHFTIDTKYKYFEAPIMGIAQQLYIYEENFLPEIYNLMLNTIKQRTTKIFSNKIFFDSYNNIVYLSNGTSSIQSIILDKIEEVYYKENRLNFSLLNEEKSINFMTDNETIKEFSEFITTYNLRKIAQNFDYQTDKLINVTENTKLVIDFSRDRLVYCANLDTLSKFSYITIPFNTLKKATAEKSGNKFFVRILANEDEIIDVSCKKFEVAQYIVAQIQANIMKI